jgi:micrococcal nuclease
VKAGIVLMFAVACGAADAASHVITGTVTRVADGDTLWVQPDDRLRKPVKLRLHGIDAPERCQPWGEHSRAALVSRVQNRRVVFESYRVDDYGRALGKLTLDGDDVSAWMVAEGHAWSARWHRRPGPYGDLEQSAKVLRKGLFAQRDAIEPRTFRKLHGPCE